MNIKLEIKYVYKKNDPTNNLLKKLPQFINIIWKP